MVVKDVNKIAKQTQNRCFLVGFWLFFEIFCGARKNFCRLFRKPMKQSFKRVLFISGCTLVTENPSLPYRLLPLHKVLSQQTPKIFQQKRNLSIEFE